MKLLKAFCLLLCLDCCTADDGWITAPEFDYMLPKSLEPFLATKTKTKGECFMLCAMKGQLCSSIAYSEQFGLCKLYSHNNLTKPLPALAADPDFHHTMYYKRNFCPVGWEMDLESQRCYLVWSSTALQRPAAWKVCDEHLASELVTFKTPQQRSNLYKILQAKYNTIQKWWTGYAMFGATLWPRPVEEIDGYIRRRGDCSGNDLVSSVPADNPADCALSCDRSHRDRCVSFTFARNTSLCYLKMRSCDLPFANYADSKDTWTYEKIHAGRPPSSHINYYIDGGHILCTYNDKYHYPATLALRKCFDLCHEMFNCVGVYYRDDDEYCCWNYKNFIFEARVPRGGPLCTTWDVVRDIDRGPCPYGIRYHDVCLTYGNGKTTAYDAAEKCRQMGGMLPTPVELSQKGRLITALYDKYHNANAMSVPYSDWLYYPWVDYTDDGHEGNYTTRYTFLPLSDSTVYERWPIASGEPNGAAATNCMAPQQAGLRMGDQPCSNSSAGNFFTCETPVSQSWPQKCRFTPAGQEYNGAVQQTASGVVCKNWASTSYDNSTWPKFPEFNAYHNYCRNPDPALMPNGPWCVRSDNGQPEYCDTISLCPETDWAAGQNFINPKQPYATITASATSDDSYDWIVESFDASAYPICSIAMTDWCPYLFGGSCYMFYNLPRNRSEASAICAQNGWHLVAFNSVQEISFISKIILSLGKGWWPTTYGYHIGLQRNLTVANSNYTMWENGDPVTVTYWKSGKPTISSTTNACVYTGYSLWSESWRTEWYDEVCSLDTFFICEIEISDR